MVSAMAGTAQGGGVNDPYKTYEFTVRDCFRNPSRYKIASFKDSIKPNTIMRGHRIWRTISLDNRENRDLFNTNSGKCSQIGLFEVIKFGIFEKKLNVFSSDDFNDVARTRMDSNEIRSRISVRDTNEVAYFDAQGVETKSVTIENRYFYNSDIKSYLLKEDWIMNSYSGTMEKRIVGLAPLVYEKKTEKVVPVFWLYYDEWKYLFSAFEAKNFYSNERLSYREIFEKKYFISRLSKESNIFDRNIKFYKFGEESALEQELIKLKLNNAEKDNFEH